MMTADIILKVRKLIPLLLLATVLTYGLTYYLLLKNFVIFASETSFYINENVVLNMGMGHVDPQELNILSTIATNKVLLLIGSDELRDSIVKDFDLYKHYHIQTEDQFAHEQVLSRLNKKIIIRREPSSVGLVHLTVEDPDRFIAAGIANKIVERVNLMNKEILKNDLKKKASHYESILPELEDKATVSRKQFVTFLDSIAPTLSKDNTEFPRYRLLASDLVGKMDKNSVKYEQMLDEYYNIMGSVKTVGNDEWQCITVVKKALPDIKTWSKTLIPYSLAISGLALLLYISAITYFIQNEDHMQLLILAIRGKQEKK